MRISVAADEDTGVATYVVDELRHRGHEVLTHGALQPGERHDWAWASEAAARDVADGRADQAVVCCWTGTGASIAANKVPGIRAALCVDAYTADGARKWNDDNVLALSLRMTSQAELGEILDAWLAGAQPRRRRPGQHRPRRRDPSGSLAAARVRGPWPCTSGRRDHTARPGCSARSTCAVARTPCRRSTPLAPSRWPTCCCTATRRSLASGFAWSDHPLDERCCRALAATVA